MFTKRTKSFFDSSPRVRHLIELSPNSQSRPRNFSRPYDKGPNAATSAVASQKPCELTMKKLQSFEYNPISTMPPTENPRSEGDTTECEHPATPMPQRIPLSELMSNTPKNQESCQEVSPREKVIWKLSPNATPAKPTASQESPSTKMTTFLKFLNEEESQKKVLFVKYLV